MFSAVIVLGETARELERVYVVNYITLVVTHKDVRCSLKHDALHMS